MYGLVVKILVLTIDRNKVNIYLHQPSRLQTTLFYWTTLVTNSINTLFPSLPKPITIKLNKYPILRLVLDSTIYDCTPFPILHKIWILTTLIIRSQTAHHKHTITMNSFPPIITRVEKLLKPY